MVNNKRANPTRPAAASIEAQIAQLRTMKAAALRTKYREVFGEESRSGNREFLFRRVAWRLQVLAEGDLPERARRRALEIANDADLRIQAAKPFRDAMDAGYSRDPRLPAAGTVLRRVFRDATVEVTVLEEGFEFQGRQYRSLSAIASQVAGSRWNGFLFFGLAEGQGDAQNA